MSEKKGEFDMRSFYRALDAARLAQNMTWKQVSGETSVSTSTLARMAKERRPDADSLAALAAWSGLNPADFVRSVSRPERPHSLALISSCLRSDPRLDETGAALLEDMLTAAYQRLAADEATGDRASGEFKAARDDERTQRWAADGKKTND